MTMLRIGLAQARQTASLETNGETILRFVEQAGAAGVRILCFPEGQTAGYRVDITPADAPVEAVRLDDLHARVARRCGELGMACILGTETPVAGAKPLNSALVIAPSGTILGVHHKTRLTPMDALAYSAGGGFTAKPGTEPGLLPRCGGNPGSVPGCSPRLHLRINQFVDASVIGPVDYCDWVCKQCWHGMYLPHSCIACIFCNGFTLDTGAGGID